MDCTSSAQTLAVGLVGNVWKPRTIGQRFVLYLSSSVQENKNNCEKFALLIKTECKIDEPVISMFYDKQDQLSETNIVVGFDSSMAKSGSAIRKISKDFDEYFKAEDKRNHFISCPSSIRVGEELICATSMTNAIWWIEGAKMMDSGGHILSNKPLIIGTNLSPGIYHLYNILGTEKIRTDVTVYSDPMSLVTCALASDQSGFNCSEKLTGGEVNFEVSNVKWFINGIAESACENKAACSQANKINGDYFVQKISTDPRGVRIISNVAIITVKK
jgi:hypothetical protein